ncbi:MAG: hypothetical protein ABSF71_39140 [Terriglobia bacterium]|jgi:hypothetical protein
MVQIFRDIHDVRNAGLATGLTLWLWTLNDLVHSVPGEWRQALIRANTVELPVRRWADSVVVPFVVGGSLLVAGNLGATFVESPIVHPTAHASGSAWNVAFMLVTCIAVTLGLGILGILGAFFAARGRRAENWIKL